MRLGGVCFSQCNCLVASLMCGSGIVPPDMGARCCLAGDPPPISMSSSGYNDLFDLTITAPVMLYVFQGFLRPL